MSTIATAGVLLGHAPVAKATAMPQVQGPPPAQVPVPAGRDQSLSWSDACLSWSPKGNEIALAATDPEAPLSQELAIWVAGLEGSRPRRLTDEDMSSAMPAWSPDGSRLAFISDRDGGCDIYTMAADGPEVARLTQDAGQNAYPAWSPDGSSLAFSSDRTGYWQIWVMGSDGSDQRQLTKGWALDREPAWSPDGEMIAFSSRSLCMGYSAMFRSILWTRKDGSGTCAVASTMADNHAPAWSPDGQCLAYVSHGPDGAELRSLDLAASETRRLAECAASCLSPIWSPDGSRLAYYTWIGPGQVWNVRPDQAKAEYLGSLQEGLAAPA